MIWNEHYNLNGKHAVLSPSGYAWLNYDHTKMRNVYLNNMRKEQGTYLHDLAHRMIITRTKAKDLKKALNMFVNDCIGFGMESEKVLFYSENCFGTADGIKFDEDSKLLRVYDLKTGTSKPSFKQLWVYCALFCLEYGYKPSKIDFECRLYQGNGYQEDFPTAEDIENTMAQIVEMDKIITDVKIETGGGLF